MTKDDIQRMAREAGISKPWDQEPVKWETLERFANLVAAAEREKAQWDGIHTCNNDCDRPACVAVRKAVIAERQACADICKHIAAIAEHNQMISPEEVQEFYLARHLTADDCAEAIRTRGQS